MEPLNIVLAGVGGQGTLVAGKLLGSLALSLGLDVKVSEVHGMSQRGGSVITYVRMGEHVFSPVIEPGTADFLLAFEELEALRWAHLLKKGGVLLVNTWRVLPLPVAMGQAQYPEGIVEQLRRKSAGMAGVFTLDARLLAAAAGHVRAVNMVMMGAMSGFTKLPADAFNRAIDDVFPEKLRALNHAAFKAGSDIMKTVDSSIMGGAVHAR
jgi:indolepyruvate ferredoxin oxidoreductase, beta subunit